MRSLLTLLLVLSAVLVTQSCNKPQLIKKKGIIGTWKLMGIDCSQDGTKCQKPGFKLMLQFQKNNRLITFSKRNKKGIPGYYNISKNILYIQNNNARSVSIVIKQTENTHISMITRFVYNKHIRDMIIKNHGPMGYNKIIKSYINMVRYFKRID